jgi:hypothetical protein
MIQVGSTPQIASNNEKHANTPNNVTHVVMSSSQRVKRASQGHVSSSNGASKVEDPHQVPCHISSHQMVS